MQQSRLATDLPIAVIGAGAGGLPAAVKLAEEGHKVILIERGGEFEKKSYPTTRYDYELKKPKWSHSDDGISWKGPIRLGRAFGIGGSTLHFQALAHLPPEGVVESWGVNKGTLNRLHHEVINFLKIAGPIQPHHPLNAVSRQILKGAHNLQWEGGPAPVAILSQLDGKRPSCNYCGLCIHGCYPGDKSSVDNTWWPRFNASPNTTSLTHHRVTKILLGSNNEVHQLRVNNSSQEKMIDVKAIVLSSGAIETPKLLLESKQRIAPQGIGNKNVGHYVTGTLWHSLIIHMNQQLAGGHAGIPIDILINQFEKDGILLAQGRNQGAISGPITAAKYYAQPKFGVHLRRWMRSIYPRIACLGGLAESSTFFKDRIDITNFTLHKEMTDGDVKTVRTMKKLLHQWMDSSNASKLNEMGSLDYHVTGAMLRGSCRMGKDYEQSSVDENGKLIGFNNIYISDSSILGRGLIANPSLTLQILGLYIGENLSHKIKSQ